LDIYKNTKNLTKNSTSWIKHLYIAQCCIKMIYWPRWPSYKNNYCSSKIKFRLQKNACIVKQFSWRENKFAAKVLPSKIYQKKKIVIGLHLEPYWPWTESMYPYL